MAKAVERALEKAKPEDAEVYRLEFVEGMSCQMAGDTLHISQRTYYRRRDRLIQGVAKELEA